MKSLLDHVGVKRLMTISRAISEANRLGRLGTEPPDWERVDFAAANEFMRLREAGHRSAYGPLVQAINDDAHSHALRGFLVGWAACKAFHETEPT